MIIKACWGGHRLRNEFRSPRMDLAPEAVLAEIQGDLRRQDTQATIDDARARCGGLYRDMVAEVWRTLADLGDQIPGNKGQGHELAGFVWLSGWNNMTHPDDCFGYSEHLTDLIRDVRADIESPRLPVIIDRFA